MGTTGDDTIGLFARCFIAAVLAFLVCSPLYRAWSSYSSWWDAAAGRRVAKNLKLLVCVEVVRDVWLLYQVIDLGNPVQGVNRDIHFYWTYGYIRPLLGILTIGMGFVAEMHPAFRLTCVAGALTQAPFDFFSAFLVGEYLIQVKDFNARTGSYSTYTLLQYYWCDVVSFGICIWTALLALHLCCIAGFVTEPYVSYQAIAGGATDRLLVLEGERERRLAYDSVQQDRYEHLSKSAADFTRRKPARPAETSDVEMAANKQV